MDRKSEFITELYDHLKPGCENVWVLDKPLKYYSALLKSEIEVPEGFEHNYDSVPRCLPLVFAFLKGRAHREMVLHDYLFRIDSKPVVTVWQANKVAKEAMDVRGKPCAIKWLYFIGIEIGGWASFHKKKVGDKLCD